MSTESTTTPRGSCSKRSLSTVSARHAGGPTFSPANSRPSSTGLPTRVLGRTGEHVSILCLGGWHIGSVKDPADAIRMMHTAVDEGLTFFDNCWDYHDGGAEKESWDARCPAAVATVFLMTKTASATTPAPMRVAYDNSVRRLRTESDRPLAVSRNHLQQRSGLGLRAGRPEGGSRSAESRQGPVHRLHGPQGSPHPPVDGSPSPSSGTAVSFRSTCSTCTIEASRSRCCRSASRTRWARSE